MLSWQELYTLGQTAVQDDSAATLTELKADLNRGIHLLESKLNLPPLERTRSITTTTSDTYALPEDCIRPKLLYVTISGIRYTALPVFDEYTWQRIKSQTTSTTSNILRQLFVRPGSNQFEIYPTPASAGNTMTLVYEAVTKDLSHDDYTTGTITTLANAGTAVTFSGATLATWMAGAWIKTDDEAWYLISSVNTGAGTAVLKQPYQGTSISAGSSTFTIGQMSRLPEGTQQFPVDYAAWKYFLHKKRDPVQAKIYQNNWEDDIKTLNKDYAGRFTSSIIKSPRRALLGMRNPNNYPSDLN